MGIIFPGFIPGSICNGPWWFAFHQVPDAAEALVEGKELKYL